MGIGKNVARHESQPQQGIPTKINHGILKIQMKRNGLQNVMVRSSTSRIIPGQGIFRSIVGLSNVLVSCKEDAINITSANFNLVQFG